MNLAHPTVHREVLGMDLAWMDNLVRVKPSQRLPTVLSVAEVQRLFGCMEALLAHPIGERQ
jgi:hypothetical protein